MNMLHLVMHLINGGNPPRSIYPPVPAHQWHPIIGWVLRGGWKA